MPNLSSSSQNATFGHFLHQSEVLYMYIHREQRHGDKTIPFPAFSKMMNNQLRNEKSRSLVSYQN